ncbi:MAG: MBL fold metallo-hydrolase [Clostridia bacterium]|nr:MBL fold metallo-hydrolase [Clostridia bacterium]
MNEFITKIKKLSLGGSNSYLLECAQGYILIDAGMKGAAARLSVKLKRLGVEPCEIKLIILTHGHYDHAAGLSEIRELTKAPVAIHRNEIGTDLERGLNDKNESTFLYRFIVGIFKKITPEGESGYIINPEIIIDDELGLEDFGVDARIIHTPGHTPGSISIITGDGQCVCGDSLFNIFPGSHYPIIVYDRKVLAKTYSRFEAEDCGVYYPGHGDPISKRMFIKRIATKKRFMSPNE